MDKITASEIIGEIRRSKRMYEIFEEADRMLMFFVEKENYQKELEKEVADRQEQIKTLDAEIASKMVNSAQIQNDLEDRVKKVDTYVAKKKEELVGLKDEAHAKAQHMVAAAEYQVKTLHEGIAELQRAYGQAQEELTQVHNQIRVAKNELEKVKQKFLKMVG